MIAFLSGTVAGVSSSAAYIEVGGVGYQVLMSHLALSRLPGVGEPVRVLTYLQVSEGGVALYGFLREDEKALFERLIGVSGVGPKVALATLSTFEPADFAAAVAAQDIAAVQKIPGVGKKSASRIVLELKGSLEQPGSMLFEPPAEVRQGGEGARVAPSAHGLKDLAYALMGMGFSSAEAELALEGAPGNADEAAVLQYALRRLGGR